jgi:preprotein translocase subunit YajC
VGGAGSQLIFLGLLLAIFYFMLIRPQKRRVQAHQQLVGSISEGDEVVTAGGIVGTIKSVSDEFFEVEVAPGTVIRFLKTSISRRVDEYEEDDVDSGVEDDEDAS